MMKAVFAFKRLRSCVIFQAKLKRFKLHENIIFLKLRLDCSQDVVKMANRKAFKVDESFLEKISIGAVATKSVFHNLAASGHRPIELERGSMSFKIWKEIKIKRVRVPDLICVDCGKRVESRGKTKLEISMSHSFSSPERGWDFGLEPDDYVALVKCKRSGDRPIDWVGEEPIQYISVGHMKKAYEKKQITSERPKGATEGFEARITWPSSVVKSEGEILYIDAEKLKYKKASDDRTITLHLKKKNIRMAPLVKAHEKVVQNQIIGSVVPVSLSFPCENHTSGAYYSKMLTSASLSDRYAAARVLSLFPSKATERLLLDKMNEKKEHIYIRLEAASSLLKNGNKEPLPFLRQVLDDEYLENRLETAIILGEIKNDDSCTLLVDTLLATGQHPEIRAGAAWSLGEMRNKKALEALVKVFNGVEENIRAEAARALMKLAEKYSRQIIEFIPRSNEDERAGLAWALSKSGNFRIGDLLPVMKDDEARKWIAWIIGTQNQAECIEEIEYLKSKDSEVYFAVTVLWKILSSWIEGLDIY